jgi:hypothetical protein
MNSSIFQVAILVGIFLPAVDVGVFAYLWRNSIGSFWWFLVLGGVGLYVLMAVCVTSALSNIGITGASAATPKSFFDPLTIRYSWFMLAFLVGGFLLLLGLRQILPKG